MHHAIGYCMDRSANRSGEIDTIVEIPAIGVDPWTV
jgi:hypothetical protein